MARCIEMLGEVRLMHEWCPALRASEKFAIGKIFKKAGTPDSFSLALRRDTIGLACVRDGLILEPVPDHFTPANGLLPHKRTAIFV